MHEAMRPFIPIIRQLQCCCNHWHVLEMRERRDVKSCPWLIVGVQWMDKDLR